MLQLLRFRNPTAPTKLIAAIAVVEERDPLGEELQAFFVQMPPTLKVSVTDRACWSGRGG